MQLFFTLNDLETNFFSKSYAKSFILTYTFYTFDKNRNSTCFRHFCPCSTMNDLCWPLDGFFSVKLRALVLNWGILGAEKVLSLCWTEGSVWNWGVLILRKYFFFKKNATRLTSSDRKVFILLCAKVCIESFKIL